MGRGRLLLLWLMYCLAGIKLAQAQNLLTPEAFADMVKQHHPVAIAANIEVKRARSLLTAARGGFDPLLQASTTSKTFDGINYYNYNNAEIALPTWPGLNIKAGIDYNEGYYTNPQVTRGRTSYAGIELPLAKGLLMDERRAALMTARININIAEQERRAAINNLLTEAFVVYYNWAAYYQLDNLFRRFVENNQQRIRLVRIGWQQGDRPAIDTLEAMVQLQNFQLMQAESELNLSNARLELNNFLWNNNRAIGDTLNVVPLPVEQLPAMPPEALQNRFSMENPLLLQSRLKINSLDVERRLKFQYLLPYINVKANLLNRDYNPLYKLNSALLDDNNNFGLTFSLPLRLSAGRGEYRNSKLKMQQAHLDLAAKTVDIQNKIAALENQLRVIQQQLVIANNMYNNYAALLRAEETRFNNGESSLFVVNSRELKVIEALQKLIDLRMKWASTNYKMRGAAGVLE